MKYSQARQGRTFIVRLDPGEPLVESLIGLAERESIAAAAVLVLGALDAGSSLTVGAVLEAGGKRGAIRRALGAEREATGTGTLVRDEKGRATVHVHVACGREDSTITGCVGRDVSVGYCLEVIVTELLDTRAARTVDPERHARLLVP
ncbi:MAG: DNA-binding protein [Kiritimatiellae bacterium]|nr:DNA-binding protein [Kiritimatiellia bacterium]